MTGLIIEAKLIRGNNSILTIKWVLSGVVSLVKWSMSRSLQYLLIILCI